MQLRKIIFKVAGFLAMAAVLGLSTPVLAAAYDTWSGPFNFKVTATDQNLAGKLVKTTSYATGTVKMYIGPNGPVVGPNGNYIEFFEPSLGGLRVGIQALEMVSTDIPNSKSMTIMGVGSGQLFEDNGETVVGPAYLSLTGKVALDAPGGTPTSITATLTMGGGSLSNGPNGGNFIWSGKPKVVLGKPAPIN